jgi:hypothetical protein
MSLRIYAVKVASGLSVSVAHQRDSRVRSTHQLLSDDDDLFATVDRDVLRPFLLGAAHQLAESRLGVLPLPAPRPRAARLTYDVTAFAETTPRTATLAIGDRTVLFRQLGVTTGLPGAPTDLAAALTDGVLTLTWQAPVTGGCQNTHLGAHHRRQASA